jgi:DNA-binding transcriptional LysR family regulator
VVKSLEAQIAMVRAGVGMALLPSGIERFCSPNEVTYYSFKQDLPKRDVVVMWQRDRQLNQVTRDLIDMMKNISW